MKSQITTDNRKRRLRMMNGTNRLTLAFLFILAALCTLSAVALTVEYHLKYEFEIWQSGTYWYHSHTRMQEQKGLYGALVILPRSG